MRQTTYVRFFVIALSLVLGVLDYFADVLPASWEAFIGLNLLALVANGLAVLALRRDRVRPWYAWALLAVDTFVIAVLVVAMGTAGYIGIPFFLLASVAYSLNMPRAARVQLGVALLCYPIARVAGIEFATGAVPLALVLVEELCLGVVGYLAIAGPIRFTYRVRGARRALGALARGDFTVRLPARAPSTTSAS